TIRRGLDKKTVLPHTSHPISYTHKIRNCQSYKFDKNEYRDVRDEVEGDTEGNSHAERHDGLLLLPIEKESKQDRSEQQSPIARPLCCPSQTFMLSCRSYKGPVSLL